jgi:hypothetical protein
MSTDRRSFLKSAAALGAIAAVPDTAAAVEQPAAAGARTFDPALLAALADTVLPDAIGRTARSQAVRAFATWIAAYRPVSEEMHGYGDAEITYTPADPAPNWKAQLEALDLLARRTRRRGFAALDVGQRRELVRRQLPRNATLPSNPLTASHVAIALIAHWASSPAAHDAAYNARILRGECRALADAPRKPLPIAPGGD